MPKALYLVTFYFIITVHPLHSPHPIFLYAVTITTISYDKWQNHYQKRWKKQTCSMSVPFDLASNLLSSSFPMSFQYLEIDNTCRESLETFQLDLDFIPHFKTRLGVVL